MLERIKFSSMIIASIVVGLIVAWSASMPAIASGNELGGNIVGHGGCCSHNTTIQCADDNQGGHCPSYAKFDVCASGSGRTCGSANAGHPCCSGCGYSVTPGCYADARDQQNCV